MTLFSIPLISGTKTVAIRLRSRSPGAGHFRWSRSCF